MIDLPSAEAEPQRYAGRPLLKVLECYILDSIGALSVEHQTGMRAIVQRIWAGGDDWKATVRAHLELDATLDEGLRQMWLRNQEIARGNGRSIHPVQFAKMVADQNFSSLIDEAPAP